jgi:hypothetical protein
MKNEKKCKLKELKNHFKTNQKNRIKHRFGEKNEPLSWSYITCQQPILDSESTHL